MAYSKTLRALEAYPKKELTYGSFMRMTFEGVEQKSPCHCALGAAVAQAGGTPNSFVPRYWLNEAMDLGLTLNQCDEIVEENDSFDGTRAERYAHMLAFLRRRVRENRAAQKARKAAKAVAR